MGAGTSAPRCVLLRPTVVPSPSPSLPVAFAASLCPGVAHPGRANLL